MDGSSTLVIETITYDTPSGQPPKALSPVPDRDVFEESQSMYANRLFRPIFDELEIIEQVHVHTSRMSSYLCGEVEGVAFGIQRQLEKEQPKLEKEVLDDVFSINVFEL